MARTFTSGKIETSAVAGRPIGPARDASLDGVDLLDRAGRPVLGQRRREVLALDVLAEGFDVRRVDLEALLLEEGLEFGFEL